jgi:diadenosine tetraphosphate (Ap4A) HIT family hydrolase
MTDRNAECPFCDVQAPILENDLAAVIFDRYPVNPGHALILPKRHIKSLFEMTPYGCMAMLSLLAETRRRTDIQFVRGDYNIGNQRGGVRGVIPAKQL